LILQLYTPSSKDLTMLNIQTLSAHVWNVADDVLRGLFKPHEYGDVILPFVILRRLDCVIEPRKDEIYCQLDKPVEKLHKNNRLFLLVEKFSSVDLHPDVVDNHAMGQIFEEFLRKFSEMSNETSMELSFGVSWKSKEEFVTAEAQNPNGRFFAGTPLISDGSLLFLHHMISKMEEKGSRIGIVFNGSLL